MSKGCEDSENLPDTLTPVTNSVKSQPDASANENKWGALIAKRPYLARIDLKDDRYVLGRKPSCEICLDGKSMEPNFLWLISKQHFLISRDSTLVPYIEDLSKNGTYLNGALIGKNSRVALCNGDVISVGKRELEVFEFKDMFDEASEINGKYIITKFLGSGAFGEVYLALSKRTRQRFAIKKIRMNQLHDRKTPLTEIEILESLHHVCVVHMEECLFDNGHVYLVLEYMRGGELLGRVLEKRRLPERLAKLYFYQVALAVQYLHREGITHRDLKPENILLESRIDVTRVKVTDFGLSRVVGEASLMVSVCGTLTYAAPELLSTNPRYTRLVDVWSLGCVLYFMVVGALPFGREPGESSDVLRARILSGAYAVPADIALSDNVLQLLRRMLVVDAHKRISPDEIVARGRNVDGALLASVFELIGGGGGGEQPEEEEAGTGSR